MNRIQYAAIACMAGGVLFFALNIAGATGVVQEQSRIFDVLGFVLLFGLMGGPLGLLALRAVGDGWRGRIGVIGASITLLGLLSYLVGVLYTSLVDPEMGIFYALGALLSGVGMLPLGIAVAIARRLTGWQRFAPLLVGLYYMLMIPIQIIFLLIVISRRRLSCSACGASPGHCWAMPSYHLRPNSGMLVCTLVG
ncbi:MAG: hypothetical protein MUD01_22450 [Chloroflexaceae bacterium]|jgi:hypothetical protein|nr:hypothetical protein [Chloroflexaceae bacterium]